MGAVAAAIAIVAAPSAAYADDGVSVVQFKLPDKAAVERFEAHGADLDHGFRPAAGGGVLVSAVVTPSEQARFEALGYPAVGTLQTPEYVDALRADRERTLAARDAAADALTSGAAKRAKSAVASTVRAQRADFWEDVSGVYLSIEGTTRDAAMSGNTYTGPPLAAAWFDGAGTQLGEGNLSALTDAGQYLYHASRFRIGDRGTPMPANIRVAAPNGDVATLPVKPWVDGSGTTSPDGFIQDFVTHYVTPREAYEKVRLLSSEFDNIAQLLRLPNMTNGYQRKAQTVIGNGTPYTGQTSIANPSSAVVLTSVAWGHEGGERLTAEIKAGDELSVAVAGDEITVTAAPTSTAAQVVAAINGSPAGELVTASLYRTNAGAGVVAPTAQTRLDDFLNAPTSQPRGPIEVQGIRIGNDVGRPQGEKIGVFIVCQEHAREWTTPLVCLETAERLVRNYPTDPETKALVDGLDIFIIPSVNPDGATYSMYDFSGQRKNLTNHCTATPTGNHDPAARTTWGVDINRNFSVGTLWEGYTGASTNCTSSSFAGPFPHSEPESRNEAYIQTQHPNIKFAMNVHSSGGYFMWPPSAYKQAGRESLPYPPYGTLNYFDQTADAVLNRIYSYRGTAILPSRTGPVNDVLYSAAGNQADEAYYKNGIIAYAFETGADKRLADGTNIPVGFQPPFSAVPIGGNPNLANEGHDEAMEFAHGNYALLKSALDYANDTTPPTSEATGATLSNAPVGVRFTADEASTIRYTTDGSEPTDASTEFKPNRPRELPDAVELTANTTVRWFATDFKGNRSAVQSKAYVVDMVGPTVTFTSPAADGATFTQGARIPLTFSCADENSGVASCDGGSLLDTSTPGTFTYSVTARDRAGNETVVTRGYTVIPATNVDAPIVGAVPATLSLTGGAAGTFGNFTPGVARTYDSSVSAPVTSSAGDALLSVSDPSTSNVGRLTNGAFVLAQALQMRARNATVTNPAFGAVTASLPLLAYTGPVTADAVTLDFRQAIGVNDALRSGTYSKTLTFTLSTTTP
jgi:hypothetical protein